MDQTQNENPWNASVKYVRSVLEIATSIYFINNINL